jgi:hypothetical protein
MAARSKLTLSPVRSDPKLDFRNVSGDKPTTKARSAMRSSVAVKHTPDTQMEHLYIYV